MERYSCYAILTKIKKRYMDTVVDALIKQSMKLLTELYQSLTWNRGSELAEHKSFTLVTDVDVFFCDPYSP